MAWVGKSSPVARVVAPSGRSKTFPVPVIDVARPGHTEPFGKGLPIGRREERIIADLGPAFRVGVDGRPKQLRQHLGPKAEPEKRLLLCQRHADPLDLGLDEIVAVIGAHGPAEDEGARMLGERRWQRFAEARPANVERMTALPQQAADPARGRMLLVQHDQHGPLRRTFPLRRGPGLQDLAPGASVGN
jgi:hypothetical protein